VLVVRGLARTGLLACDDFELIKVLGLGRCAKPTRCKSLVVPPSLALCSRHTWAFSNYHPAAGGGNKHLGKRPCGLEPSTQGAAGCLNPGIDRLLPSLPPRRHDFGSLRKDRVGGPQCLTDL